MVASAHGENCETEANHPHILPTGAPAPKYPLIRRHGQVVRTNVCYFNYFVLSSYIFEPMPTHCSHVVLTINSIQSKS